MRIDDSSTAPVLAVWRTNWLPASETFIRNQLAAMQRWQALRIGLRQLPNGLDLPADVAPFPANLLGKGLEKLSAQTGYRGVYDRALRQRRVRLIHAHFGPGGIRALPVARRNRLPLIVSFHGFDITTLPNKPGRDGERYRRQLNEVFQYSSVLIAVSEFVAERLIELGAPPAKVRVHHIGIPVDTGAIGSDPRSGITFVGRLVEKKGVGDLIEAVGLLAEPLRAATTVRIVGDGPLAAPLAALARERSVRTTFAGRLDSAAVSAALAQSRVFGAPSKTAASGDSEGFGMVFLEAALHGVPVAAYRHGGVVESVSDGVTGLLAAEGDVEQLSANLQRLLSDDELAQDLGAAGRARVLEHFDVRRQTSLLEEIYDEVARRPS